jgi:hypothetical protein
LDCMTAAAKRYKYLRRLVKFRQMDFEFAFWQMLYLFIAPQKVYRNFHYRKRNYCNIYVTPLCVCVCVCFVGWICVFSHLLAYLCLCMHISHACMLMCFFHIFLCVWLHMCVGYMLGMENIALEPYSSFSSLIWMIFCTRWLITTF